MQKSVTGIAVMNGSKGHNRPFIKASNGKLIQSGVQSDDSAAVGQALLNFAQAIEVCVPVGGNHHETRRVLAVGKRHQAR